MQRTNTHTRVGQTAARAAQVTPRTPYVLGISLILATAAMSFAWIVPALYL